MSNVWIRSAAVVVVLCSAPLPLYAQQAVLAGTIRDASDAVLPGATVTARRVDGGAPVLAVSDASGAYRLVLPPGRYRITAELSGFMPAVRDSVDVGAGGQEMVDLTLAVSGLAETVAVTGSQIRTSGFQALVPVQVESRAEIENSGTAVFADLFREIPANSGSEATSESLPRYGQSQFNLRGLGYSSTLTLVNGRRAAVSPVSDETGAEFTDVNQFPLAMVERVEVLKDGASAIYGSDAVAGVVNVITRRGFAGAEVSGGLQSASNRDGFLNLATGHRYRRGVVNLYATHYQQTGNDRTAFDWLVERVGGNGVLGRSQLLNTNGAPSTYRLGGPSASGVPVAIGSVGVADPDCEAAGGVFRIRDDGTVDRSSCLHNFADQVAVLPDSRRTQIFAELTHQVNARATLSADVAFSRNVNETTRGPGGYSNGTVTNAGGSVYIPASHPFNFFQADPANPSRLVYIPPSQWNPTVNSAVDVVASLRPLGVAYNGRAHAGERSSQTDYPRADASLDIDLGHAWVATASYQFARADFSDRQELRYNANVLNGLIASGLFNPFGTSVVSPTLVSPKDGRSVAENSQAVIDQFITDSLDLAATNRQVAELSASGNLFSLGGQQARLGIGAQFRRLSYDTTPDPIQGPGHGDNSTITLPVHGNQNVAAAFGELAAPLGTAAATQLALRFEDYGRYGATVNPKAAGTVSAGERLRLRASWGTSFQAPTMFQTSTTSTRLFLNDPVTLVNGRLVCQNTGILSGNTEVDTIGDANLRPQHSVNYNAGVIASPVRGMQVSVDYWRYRYKDLIASGANAQAIVNNDCNDGVPDDPRIVRQSDGTLGSVTTSFLNVGRVTTDGLDFAAEHHWGIGAAGSLSATADATWLHKFDVVGGEGGVFNGAGSRNFANNFRSMPQWRGVAGLEWLRSVQHARVKMRYIGSYKNDSGNDALIDHYAPIDLLYAYTFAGRGRYALTMVIGVDNAFDLDPPALVRNDASGQRITSATFNYIERPGYDAYSGADLRGRVVWLRMSHRF